MTEESGNRPPEVDEAEADESQALNGADFKIQMDGEEPAATDEKPLKSILVTKGRPKRGNIFRQVRLAKADSGNNAVGFVQSLLVIIFGSCKCMHF